MSNTRRVTNLLLGLMEDGVIPPEVIAEAALRYMSEDDVADMAHCEGMIDEDEDSAEE